MNLKQIQNRLKKRYDFVSIIMKKLQKEISSSMAYIKPFEKLKIQYSIENEIFEIQISILDNRDEIQYKVAKSKSPYLSNIVNMLKSEFQKRKMKFLKEFFYDFFRETIYDIRHYWYKLELFMFNNDTIHFKQKSK